MITSEKELKELRDFYVKDYFIRTGQKLVCIERKRVSKGSKKLMKDKIIEIASTYFVVSEEDIIARTRVANIIEVRQMLVKYMTEMRLTQDVIAAKLNQDRSNIYNTLQTFAVRYKENQEYKRRYIKFKEYCKRELEKVTYYEDTGKISGK